jgi:hypothetical protein
VPRPGSGFHCPESHNNKNRGIKMQNDTDCFGQTLGCEHAIDNLVYTLNRHLAIYCIRSGRPQLALYFVPSAPVVIFIDNLARLLGWTRR